VVLNDEIIQKLELEKEKSFDKVFYADLYNAGAVIP